jgi:CubicO group peptidase (beta-lactamase class C family)
MTRTRSLKYLLVFFLVSISARSFAQPADAEAKIQEAIKKYEAVGLSVAVVKKGKIIYTHSFGLKDIENNTALSENSLFRIASISKSFSATSVMQLADKGKLSLADDFSKLVGFKVRNPKYPETVITLKMVMSHTSSINDSQGYFNLDVINPAKNPDWAKCYNDYEPGKGYLYCNLNYNMTGAVIENLSGERFDQYVKHSILDPLKLYGGYCVDSLDNRLFTTLYEYDTVSKKFTAAPMAYAPRREELKNYVMGYSTPILSPTGGMKISVPDLARYMTMHMYRGEYNGVRILSKKSSATMQAKISDEEGYGLAIRTVDNLIPGKIMKGHTGSAYGLYSTMFFQSDEKFGFVVITNGCRGTYSNGFNDLLATTVNILYDNFIK